MVTEKSFSSIPAQRMNPSSVVSLRAMVARSVSLFSLRVGTLWTQLSVVEERSGALLQQSFNDLLTIFIEHASDEALPLTPGHAYFLGTDDEARTRLTTSVRPLLEEYLAQGYVAGFADEIRAYV